MYKRIDVYLGMAAALLAFVLAVPVAQADCQFQLSANTQAWHVMWGPNAGDEREMVMPGGAGINKLTNDQWAFSITSVFSTGCDELDPTPLAGLSEGQFHEFTSGDAGFGTCTVTDTGNTTKQLTNCVNRFTKTRAPDYWINRHDWCYFIVDHWCYE